MNIELNGYSCFDVANEGYFDCERINKRLTCIREFIDELPFQNTLEIVIHVLAYDADSMNAFAIKHDTAYYLCISTKTFSCLWDWFSMWTKRPKMSLVFPRINSTQDDYIRSFYIFSLYFLAMHEFAHIINGHCDFADYSHNCLNDDPILPPPQRLIDQVLELDADRTATLLCIHTISRRYSASPERVVEVIHRLSFSIYNVFIIFENDDCRAVDSFTNFMSNPSFGESHPYNSIRAQYLFAIIIVYVGSFTDTAGIIKYFARPMATNMCVFEKEVLGKAELRSCLYSQAYTEKGCEITMTLHNAWGDIYDKLKPFAHVELRLPDLLDKMHAFVTESGGFIGVTSK